MKRGMAESAVRLLILQGSMNFERLQGIGAAVAIEPLIRDLEGGQNGDRYRTALGRSAGFFNTNPYLAGVALGAVAQAEHAGASTQQIERLRSVLKGALGSLGDRLIWTGALPVSVAIGLVCATVTPPFVAAAAFLTVFNAVHITARWWGLRAGWRSGVAVAQTLRHPALQGAAKWAGPVAAFGIGVALPIAGEWLTANLETALRLGTGGVAVVTGVAAWWLTPSLGAARMGILASALVLALGLLW